MSRSTLITVATYNEMDNLPQLIGDIRSVLPEADVMVVDDNSPDGTGQWCQRKSRDDSHIHCLIREGKLGLGTAIVAGMRYALDNGYTALLNLDADFSHHPRYIPQLVAGILDDDKNACDVMIGSRYIPGGKIEGWPVIRRLMSRGVNFYARWMLGLKVKDCSGAFRCYRVETLKRVDLEEIRSWGYSFQEEILWRLKRTGARISEIPITFADREKGQSKINSREAISALWIILRLGMINWFKI